MPSCRVRPRGRSLASMFLVLGICLALLPAPMMGQTFYGSIVGAVTDATGAVVEGAKVTLTNIGTGGSRTASEATFGRSRIRRLWYIRPA